MAWDVRPLTAPTALNAISGKSQLNGIYWGKWQRVSSNSFCTQRWLRPWWEKTEVPWPQCSSEINTDLWFQAPTHERPEPQVLRWSSEPETHTVAQSFSDRALHWFTFHSPLHRPRDCRHCFSADTKLKTRGCSNLVHKFEEGLRKLWNPGSPQPHEFSRTAPAVPPHCLPFAPHLKKENGPIRFLISLKPFEATKRSWWIFQLSL